MMPTPYSQQTISAANDEYIPRAIVRHVYGLPPSWLRQQYSAAEIAR